MDQVHHRAVKRCLKSFELRERHDANAVRVRACHVKVCVSGYAARAGSNSQAAYSVLSDDSKNSCVVVTMASR